MMCAVWWADLVDVSRLTLTGLQNVVAEGVKHGRCFTDCDHNGHTLLDYAVDYELNDWVVFLPLQAFLRHALQHVLLDLEQALELRWAWVGAVCKCVRKKTVVYNPKHL